MKTKFLRNTMAVAFVSAFAMYSVQASAAVITTFNQDTGFKIDGTLKSIDVTTPLDDIVHFNSTFDAPAGTFGTIAWGLATNNVGGYLALPGLATSANTTYSGLQLVGYAGDIRDDAWTSISTISHINRSISSSTFVLQSAEILSELTLGGGLDTSLFAITAFTETPNNGNCVPAVNPLGSDCDDRFTFAFAELAPILYWDGTDTYRIDFRFANFVNSASDYPECTEFGECTFYTREGQNSSADVQAIATKVPEPGTLALMGLGLLGLVGLKKRTKA